MADQNNSGGELQERWPGYNEQSWSERFAELDGHYKDLRHKVALHFSRTPAKAGEDGVERAHAAFVLAAAKIERGTRLDSLTVGEEKALVKAVLSSIEEPRE